VAGGPGRDSSSGTETTSTSSKSRGPPASARAAWTATAALHVRDAGPVAAVGVTPEGPPCGGAEREDRVVMTEQGDASPAESPKCRVQVETGRGRDELRLEAGAVANAREQPGQPVECLEVASGSVDAHPRGQICDQQVELVVDLRPDAGGLVDGDRGQSAHPRDSLLQGEAVGRLASAP
jgi:hypothetical protein